MKIKLLLIAILCTTICQGKEKRTKDAFLMGGRFDITLVADDAITAERYIDTVIAEISRIEHLISDWKPTSQVSEVNRNAGIKPVKVDREVFELTAYALSISEITNGAFDISFAAMEKIWKFDGSMTEMPSSEAVKNAKRKVGYSNIILNKDSSTIFLKLPGMKIGFGAIGEGYAVDRCRDLMTARGIEGGLINATGDIQAWGQQPDGTTWKVGINDPFGQDTVISILQLDGGIATSGSYEKFAMINGKRYAHIINPATGYPATGLVSVSVNGSSTKMANALSTSIMVLGVKKGLKLLKKFPGYHCLMITDKGEKHQH